MRFPTKLDIDHEMPSILHVITASFDNNGSCCSLELSASAASLHTFNSKS